MGIGDHGADRGEPWPPEQHRLVADHPGGVIRLRRGRAPGRYARRHKRSLHHPDLGLADLLDARVFETRQRWHTACGYETRLSAAAAVDRCVDAVAGAFHLAGAALALAVVDADS
jgi:hypothetical protein